jgi:hypothetical protein
VASEELKARWIADEERDILIGFLDLCGTKAVYRKLSLKNQVSRITKVVSKVSVELSNAFGKNQESLYVHMFADSVVIAERSTKDSGVSLNKLLYYFLRVQFDLLLQDRSQPILCRCMVRKGKYYGICFDQSPINFSLVGGPTIIEMDKELEGLPAGVYIDHSLAPEFADQKRLIAVEGDRLKFVNPPEDFLSFHFLFSDHDNVDQWVEEMIEASQDENFTRKIKPWADTVAGRSKLIQRESKQ